MVRPRTVGRVVRPGEPGDDALPLDLRDPGEIPWAALEVPDDWRAVARISEQVAADPDRLVERVVAAIREEVPDYTTGLVPDDDLAASVQRSLGAVLVGLAEHRGPTAEELRVRRELGARRAAQGMPIDALLEAFHIGYRELWLALVDAVADDVPDVSLQLLTAATTFWQWVHAIADALSGAHATTSRAIEARMIGNRQRFVELVVTGELDGDEAARLGQTLGFDPDGHFVACVVQGVGHELDALELQRALEPLPGHHAAAVRGTLLVIVAQPGSADHLAVADIGSRPGDPVARVTRASFPEAAIGIGAVRTGLHGARASVEDATHALAITTGDLTTDFDEVWLWATLHDVGDRLAPLLAPGVEVAGTHPHLAEAIHAFAESGFSLSEASRRLSLHANTVAYRLDRWEELTGWDPKTFAGLVRSLASLRSTSS